MRTATTYTPPNFFNVTSSVPGSGATGLARSGERLAIISRSITLASASPNRARTSARPGGRRRSKQAVATKRPVVRVEKSAQDAFAELMALTEQAHTAGKF